MFCRDYSYFIVKIYKSICLTMLKMGAKKLHICDVINEFEDVVFKGREKIAFADLCARVVETCENRFHKERFAILLLIKRYFKAPKSYQFEAAVENYFSLMENHSYAKEKGCNCAVKEEVMEKYSKKTNRTKRLPHDDIDYSVLI